MTNDILMMTEYFIWKFSSFQFLRWRFCRCPKKSANKFWDQVKAFLGPFCDCSLCFDFARPMFWLCSTYVLTVLDLCFDCARPMFWFSRPKSGMFWLCSDYVSTVLDLCLDCNRPMFRLSRPKLGMFRFSRPMFRLSRPKSILFWFCSWLCFDFLGQNWACFKFLDQCFNFLELCFIFLLKLGMPRLSRPMFWFSRPKSGMFWLCSDYVSTVLDLCLDCDRPMFRLWSTYV